MELQGGAPPACTGCRRGARRGLECCCTLPGVGRPREMRPPETTLSAVLARPAEFAHKPPAVPHVSDQHGPHVVDLRVCWTRDLEREPTLPALVHEFDGEKLREVLCGADAVHATFPVLPLCLEVIDHRQLRTEQDLLVQVTTLHSAPRPDTRKYDTNLRKHWFETALVVARTAGESVEAPVSTGDVVVVERKGATAPARAAVHTFATPSKGLLLPRTGHGSLVGFSYDASRFAHSETHLLSCLDFSHLANRLDHRVKGLQLINAKERLASAMPDEAFYTMLRLRQLWNTLPGPLDSVVTTGDRGKTWDIALPEPEMPDKQPYTPGKSPPSTWKVMALLKQDECALAQHEHHMTLQHHHPLTVTVQPAAATAFACSGVDHQGKHTIRVELTLRMTYLRVPAYPKRADAGGAL